MLSIFSIPYGNFELDPKINKGLTLRAPFGVPPGQRGTPGAGQRSNIPYLTQDSSIISQNIPMMRISTESDLK